VDFVDETSPGAESVSASAFVEKPDQLSEKTEPKKGPPDLKEWQDFFARIVVRILIEGYLALVLGDLFDELTPAEAAQLTLSKEDMSKIAVPLATTANSSSFMQKHGRTIITIGDSYESLLLLLLWMRRVNRIARKHGKTRRRRNQNRPVTGRVVRSEENNNAGFDVDSSGESGGAPINGFVFNPGSG
jgi:hypothetical protein